MKKVKKIVIVGGGSSGWMTAAVLSYKLKNIDITLIESERIGNIGVGESTLSDINTFFQILNLKDEEWMSHCDATYKNSIQFTDFHRTNKKFQYPFGVNSIHIENLNVNFQQFILDFLIINKLGFIEGNQFPYYLSFNGFLAKYNTQIDDSYQGVDMAADRAYHIDADKLAIFLKEKFCKNVKHVISDVVDVKLDITGDIEHVLCDNNECYDGDIFIDCSGFKSILIEDVMKEEFIDFDYLINDRAISARIPYIDRKKEIVNVTDCKAVECGWIWDIPLWSRKGKGLVYSSKFTSDDDAEFLFRKECGWDGDVRRLKFRHGYRKKSWVKNVISIGLSSGFIEPLESSGLLLTHLNIIKLLEIFTDSDMNVSSIHRTLFNEHVYRYINGMSEFVALHYGFSDKNDSPYWNHVTSEIEYFKQDPNSLSNYLMQCINCEFSGNQLGLYVIAFCMNKNFIQLRDHIENFTTIEDALKYDRIKFMIKYITEFLEKNDNYAKNLTNNYDYVLNKIYGGIYEKY